MFQFAAQNDISIDREAFVEEFELVAFFQRESAFVTWLLKFEFWN